MGLIDFVKSAGEKLGLGAPSEEEKEAAANEAYEDAKARLGDRRVAHAIAKKVGAMNFSIDDFSVNVDGDTATVNGTAANQEVKEKVALVVGNTEGIARVDDRMVVGAAGAGGNFHTVESGDTLSAIAKKHYGDASKYNAIFEANKPMLSDPDKIYPGQVLRIPSLD